MNWSIFGEKDFQGVFPGAEFWKIAQNYKYHLTARELPPGASAVTTIMRGWDGRH